MGGGQGSHSAISRKITEPARLAALCFLAGLLLLPAKSSSEPQQASPSFQDGESLKYQLKWLGLTIATARLTVEGPVRWEGKRVFRLRGRVKSTGLLKRLLRVDDSAVSYADASGLFSHRIEIRQREGRYRAKRWNTFGKRRAVYGRPNRPPRHYEIAGKVHDLLSGIYKARSLDLRPGKIFVVNIFHTKKPYPVRLMVGGAETSDTLWGAVRTLVVQPEFIDNDYLKGLATTWIYITAGHHKIPVRLESKTYLGPFVSHLIESKGVPSGPLSKPPIKEPQNWRPTVRRVKKGSKGGLMDLKNLLNKSKIKGYKKEPDAK
ncbi:DUF3108 domain-containing protein [Nitrospinota bacterium]